LALWSGFLFFNPKLSRVRFELGTLYFRLGSYEMARGYFQTVQTAADATPEMQQHAQEYLDAIEKKLQPDQLSGYAQTGFRYQTNATYGPSQHRSPAQRVRSTAYSLPSLTGTGSVFSD